MKKLKRPVALLLAIVMLISMMNLTVFADEGGQSPVVSVDGLAITEESALICGLEESEGHIHDESCYTTQTVLTCEIPENHTHTIDCYEQSEMGYETEIDGGRPDLRDPRGTCPQRGMLHRAAGADL